MHKLIIAPLAIKSKFKVSLASPESGVVSGHHTLFSKINEKEGEEKAVIKTEGLPSAYIYIYMCV